MIFKHKIHPMKWVVWALAVIFYFYEFFLRVFPSVMVPELMETFHVEAAIFGLMSAWYFFIYAPMQIPIGGMMDRYGARKLLTFAAFVCGVGSILFAFAFQLWMASLGRFLMGLGSAFGFVGMVYISSHWFPLSKLALLIGIGNSVGMLGAVFGQGPMSLLVDAFGWRMTVLFLGIVGFALTIAIYLVVRNEPKAISSHPKELKKEHISIIGNYKDVVSNVYSWVNAIGGFFVYATTTSFAGLWGVAFLTNVYKMSTTMASFASSMIFVGWVIGGPILGHYSDKVKRRKPVLILCSLIACILTSILIYLPTTTSHVLLFILLLIIGIFASVQLLCYSYSIDINPLEAKGVATSFTNFFVILAGSLIQPLVGYFLDLNASGPNIYGQMDYRWAMTTFPACFFLAFVCFCFLKEKKNEPIPT